MKVKQILFSGIGKVEYCEVEFQPPSELYRDDLLLETEYTLISPGTEMECLMGRAGGNSFPKCLGYSAVCRVAKCGAEATGFQIGDRGTQEDPHYYCTGHR